MNDDSAEGAGEGQGQANPEAGGAAPDLSQKVVELEAAAKAAADRAEKAEADAKLSKTYTVKLIERLKEMSEQGQQPQQDELDFLDRFKNDPEGAIDAHVNARLAPIVEEQLKNQESVAMDMAKRAVGDKVWGRYQEQLREFMGPLSLVLRAKPEAWVNAVQQLRAANIEKEIELAMKEKVESEKQAQLESVSPAGPARRGKQPISDVERKIAEGLLGEFNEDEWRKWRGDTLTKE